MRKKLYNLTDLRIFFEECEERLKRYNYADIGIFMDIARYLVLIVHFSRDKEDIDRLIGILNKYFTDNWKTEIYDHEEDFFVAMHKDLLDLLEEVAENEG